MSDSARAPYSRRVRGRRTVAGLLVAAAAAGANAALGGSGPERASSVATPSACAVPPGPLSYNWPVKPFRVPHPVRGNFGDPRTVFDAEGGGRFSFHNGVDIVAVDGTAVYPVVSGTVVERFPDELIVETKDGRRFQFQYYHLVSLERKGEEVVRGKTLLGWVRPGAHHVHLAEIDDAIVQNPLTPGHLMPYRDPVAPVVEAVALRDAEDADLAADRLKGDVRIVADAYDLPSLPVDGAWHDLPVAPAVLSWGLATPDDTQVVPLHTTVDFRTTEPPDWDFRLVYEQGTIQNFAAVGTRYLYGQPGRYRFDPTPQPFDTRFLAAGPYVLTVTASDICGNSGSLELPVTVLPQIPRLQPEPGGRLGWPAGLSAYTLVLAAGRGTGSRLVAATVAAWARARGLPETGYLFSNRFAGLERGLWVVLSGAYASLEQARAAAAAAAPLFPRAAALQVAPQLSLTRWRPDERAETIVLHSVPVARGLAEARKEAKRAQAAGLRHVGVLVSSHFRSLDPGYYVVFSGAYRDASAAGPALTRALAVYPAAYVREVSP